MENGDRGEFGSRRQRGGRGGGAGMPQPTGEEGKPDQGQHDPAAAATAVGEARGRGGKRGQRGAPVHAVGAVAPPAAEGQTAGGAEEPRPSGGGRGPRNRRERGGGAGEAVNGGGDMAPPAAEGQTAGGAEEPRPSGGGRGPRNRRGRGGGAGEAVNGGGVVAPPAAEGQTGGGAEEPRPSGGGRGPRNRRERGGGAGEAVNGGGDVAPPAAEGQTGGGAVEPRPSGGGRGPRNRRGRGGGAGEAVNGGGVVAPPAAEGQTGGGDVGMSEATAGGIEGQRPKGRGRGPRGQKKQEAEVGEPGGEAALPAQDVEMKGTAPAGGEGGVEKGAGKQRRRRDRRKREDGDAGAGHVQGLVDDLADGIAKMSVAAPEEGKEAKPRRERREKAGRQDKDGNYGAEGAGGAGAVTEGGGQEGASKKRNKKKDRRNRGAADSEAVDGEPVGTSRGETVGNKSHVNPLDATAKDYYFDSYAHFGIHEEMLKDSVRTKAYRDAILDNKHLFEGKIVLDVGCGTGILCMFAARAGAKHVYGVDCSGIINSAQQIVKDNKLDDKITLIHGKVEELELPVEKVDIIISEWMGYALFYESMLDTVLFARDKWLKAGGHIMPDKAIMWVQGAEDRYFQKDKIDFWDDVYGFNMSCIKKTARLEPVVENIQPDLLCTKPFQLKSVDIMTVQKKDLTFDVPYRLIATRNDYMSSIVMYFDVAFTVCKPPLWMTTGPKSEPTHWRQTIFHFHNKIVISEHEAVSGRISCRPNAKNHRDLDFRISVQHQGKVNGFTQGTYQYKMR